MKRIFSFLMALLFLLNGSAVFADVIFAPESDFYEAHRKECVYVNRDYYTNGTEGYIGLYKQPEGTLTEYITNAQTLRIVYSYNGWGMISYINGSAQDVEKWAKLDDLYLIYDERSFCEEHEAEFTKTHYELTAGTEERKKIYVYDYPGATDPWTYELNGNTLNLTNGYTDPEGRVWGKVFYHYGIRNSWVCYSQPDTAVPPFGGDPLLETFETYSANVAIPKVEGGSDEPSPAPSEQEDPIEIVLPETPVSGEDAVVEDVPIPEPSDQEDLPAVIPETDVGQPEEGTPEIYLPEEPPLRIPIEPTVFIAIGLVAIAVIASVVLVIVCYKKKSR